MWQSESFLSFPALLGWLNAHRIRPSDCKILVAVDDHGRQRYHVLYVDEDGSLERVGVAEASVGGLSTADSGDVLDEAEAIIHDAQRES